MFQREMRSMKVFIMIIACLIVMSGFANVITNVTSDGSGDYPPPENGDWIINGTTYVSNETIILNGDLIIEDGGNLTLRNVTLIMNCTSNGEFGIHVADGGKLTLIDGDGDPETTDDRTNITSYDTDDEFKFLIDPEAEFIMKNSILSECGYSSGNDGRAGLTVKSERSIIEYSTFHNNYYGIFLYSASNNSISHCEVFENTRGIFLEYAESNTILNCNITSHTNYGLYLYRSDNNTISQSNSSSNTRKGIYLVDSDFNNLTECTASFNTGFQSTGFQLDNSNHNTIIACSAMFNPDGIVLSNSDQNNITDTIASSNSNRGVLLSPDSDNNVISSNRISYNGGHGIYLSYNCIDNHIFSNTLQISGSQWGFHFSDHRCYDNNVTDNTVNGYEYLHYFNVMGTKAHPIIIENVDSQAKRTSNIGNVFLGHCENVTIRNVTIRNNPEKGLYVYSSNNISLDSINASENKFGIHLEDVCDGTIINSSSSNNTGYGLFFEESDHIAIDHSNASFNADYGMHLDHSDHFNISDCNSSFNDNDGFFISHSNNNDITDCITSNNNQGFYVSNADNNTITNCRVFNNVKGIQLSDSQLNTVTRCNVINNDYGIYIGKIYDSGCIKNSIHNNSLISTETQWGFYLYSVESYENNISDNTINGYEYHYYYGLMGTESEPITFRDIDAQCHKMSNVGNVFLGYCENITLHNITVTNNTQSSAGLYLFTSRNIIMKNIKSENNYYGVHIRDSYGVDINGSHISDNSRYGIFIEDSTFNAISETVTNSNADSCIFIDNSDNNTITDCKVQSSWSGIELTHSNDNSISNCDISSDSYGIYLKYSDSNTVTKSNISDNRDGLTIYDSSHNIITNNTFSENLDKGIGLSSSTENIIRNNVLDSNPYYWGFYFSDSESYDNEIAQNLVEGTLYHYYYDVKGTIQNPVSIMDINLPVIEMSNIGNLFIADCEYMILDNISVSNNSYCGIQIIGSNNITIINTYSEDNGCGIRIRNSDNITIHNTTIINPSSIGLSIDSSDNNHFEQVNTSIGSNGFFLGNSNHNTISNCSAYGNTGIGLRLSSSHHNQISHFDAIDNDGSGIDLSYSDHNKVSASSMKFNTEDGLEIYNSENNEITNCNASFNNGNGILIRESVFNKVIDCITNSNYNGIMLFDTAYIGISRCNASSNRNQGIYSARSDVINMTKCYAISNSDDGIALYDTINSWISNCLIDNNFNGISFNDAINITLTNNTMMDNSFYIEYSDDNVCWDSHVIDPSNTVNGNPIYYWKNRDQGMVPIGAGQVILANCTNVVVKKQNISHCNAGILMGFSSECVVVSNNCSYNENGVYLFNCDNNIISSNTFMSNEERGVYIQQGSYNEISRNNFIENKYWNGQGYDGGSNNNWNGSSEGNFWSDYSDHYPSAENDSGIWDTPYDVANFIDHYPLVQPVEIEILNIFFISPVSGPNVITVDITILGSGFVEGSTVNLTKINEDVILGEQPVFNNNNHMSAIFNISQKSIGKWDVEVHTPEGDHFTLQSAFEIKGFVYGIFPDQGSNYSSRKVVTIYGYGFTSGLSVKLSKDGEEDIHGEDIKILSMSRFIATFNLSGRNIGMWDLIVTLPSDFEGELKNAFEIVDTYGEGIFYQEIRLEQGTSTDYFIDINDSNDLFVTLQKSTLISYGNSWLGEMTLFYDDIAVASTEGSHDHILHITDPEPGLYTIRISASQSGDGYLFAGTSLPSLPTGEWVVSNIHCSYGSVWYQVDVLPDQDTLFFEAETLGLWSHFDIYYEQYGSSTHWKSPDAHGDRITSIEIPNPIPGTYIIEFMDSAMVQMGSGFSTNQTRDVLLIVDTNSIIESSPDYLPLITSITPEKGGNNGLVTIEITGRWLDEAADVVLTRDGYDDIIANDVMKDRTTLSATFNLNGGSPGVWTLVVTNPDGRSAIAPSEFTIEVGREPEIWVDIYGREKIRVGLNTQYTLHYGNSGNTDATAPLFIITCSSNVRMSLTRDGEYSSEPIQILGIGSVNPLGILPPDSKCSIPFYVNIDSQGSDVDLSVDILDPQDSMIDWDDIAQHIRPPSMTDNAWNTQLERIKEKTGHTWKDYQLALGGEASFLGQLGIVEYSVTELFRHITQRYKIVGMVVDAETNIPIADVKVIAHPLDDNSPRIGTTQENGAFIIDYLEPGEYLLCIEGYYLKDDTRIVITEGSDGDYSTLEAYPVVTHDPSPPPPTEPQIFGNMDPHAVMGENGDVHLVWEHAGGIWHGVFQGNLLESMEQIGDIEGRNPYAIFDPNLLGADSPGVMVVWEERNETNSEKLWYSVGVPGTENYLWSDPRQLTSDGYGDRNPVLSTTDQGEELILWIQRDWNNDDDTDVYYQLIDISDENLIWEESSRGEDDTSSGDSGRADKDTLSYKYSWEINPKFRVPDPIPVLKGEYGWNLTIKGTLEESCENLKGALEGDVTIQFGENRSAYGKISGDLTWNVDKQACEYVFDKASLGLEVGANFKVPAYKTPTPNWLTFEWGAKIAAAISGSMEWKGSNFPGWPTGGTFGVKLNPAIYGEANVLDIITANVEGGSSFKLEYHTSEGWKWTEMKLYVKVTVDTWLIEASFEKEYSFLKEKNTRDGRSDDDAYIVENIEIIDGIYIVDQLLVEKDTNEGTGNVYEGIPVLSTINSDRYRDGNPSIAKSDSGEILAAWTKDSSDVHQEVGSAVVVSEFDGSSWSSPVTVAGADGFNINGAVTFVSDDTPMVIWSGGPTDVTYDSAIEDILDAIQTRDIYYSYRTDDTWSTPALISHIDGMDTQLVVISTGDGRSYAAWKNTDDDVETIYAASFSESSKSWSEPVIISSSISCDSPTITVREGKPFLVWSQDTDGNPQTKEDSTLFWSEWDGSWSEPSGLAKPETMDNQATRREGELYSDGGTRGGWIETSKPDEDCCKEKEDNDNIKKNVKNPRIPTSSKRSMSNHRSTPVSSTTPEDKYGPEGFDQPDTPISELKHFIPEDQHFYYRIDYWNKENATAPALDVFVTDQLDENLDWNSMRFEEIGFLNWTVKLEPCQYFNIFVDLRPEMDLIVNVIGIFDPGTGVINWTFLSLDPVSYFTPDDPMAGFLPPITPSGYEIGWVCFSVDPKTDLPTGTQIKNQAYVEFDWAGDLLDHPAPKEGPFVNTIDSSPPSSTISATLLADGIIQLEWHGDDNEGSGIRDYSIFVSDNGASFEPWLLYVTDISAKYDGEYGHTYSFYSIASDNLGNHENPPIAAEIEVYIDFIPTISITNPSYESKFELSDKVVMIEGTTSDDIEVKIVQIKIDNGGWKNVDGTTNWNFVWDITAVAPGAHSISVRAFDGIAHSEIVSIVIIIEEDFVEDEKEDEENLNMIFIISIVLIIFMVFGLLLFWTKYNDKKSLEEETAEAKVRKKEENVTIPKHEEKMTVEDVKPEDKEAANGMKENIKKDTEIKDEEEKVKAKREEEEEEKEDVKKEDKEEKVTDNNSEKDEEKIMEDKQEDIVVVKQPDALTEKYEDMESK